MADLRTKILILRELSDIIELWSETPVIQHLITIQRPVTDVYSWTDEAFLKKIEKYRDDLENIKEEDIYEQRERERNNECDFSK